MKTIVFPGSFDPITYGHLDLIKRLREHFDKVVVLIGVSLEKKYLFSPEERRSLILNSLEDTTGIEVDHHSGLTVQYLKKNNYKLLARGVRSVADYEMEMNMAQMNKSLDSSIETFFLTTSPEYSFVASRYIKEVAKFDGELNKFVSPAVKKALLEKING